MPQSLLKTAEVEPISLTTRVVVAEHDDIVESVLIAPKRPEGHPSRLYADGFPPIDHAPAPANPPDHGHTSLFPMAPHQTPSSPQRTR